ncbi:DUF3052 domain-containing protein [Aquimarina sp. 2201CG14-23]|uniref:DUF3052 domain-containing protein n=1 Tax=Aquimarina mycalae TaxID=3040073 RepID=UPI00247822D3|nr:DUF3052 domain-containing protein [Aquimarina sp. 2201CG14-23]MDH7445638.1 DUF3052 domain-containing protein [Aquimarina sp. 2201CG14-23]
MPAGYSGTPLAKKLGIKKEFKCLFYNRPDYYLDLFADLPKIVELNSIESEQADFIHIFCTTYEELQNTASKYKLALKKAGMLWVSWPKGSSKISTDLKREPVRECLIKIGLVDVKVAAIDEDWSGLKFVYRVKDR